LLILNLAGDAMLIKRATTGTCLQICWLVLAAATGNVADQTAADESAASRAGLDQLKRDWAETDDAPKQHSAAQRDEFGDDDRQTADPSG
jgi:hypothetical protein